MKITPLWSFIGSWMGFTGARGCLYLENVA